MEDLLMASDCEGAELEVGGLGDSAASPLGRTPSANHTLLCSRETDPECQRHAIKLKASIVIVLVNAEIAII